MRKIKNIQSALFLMMLFMVAIPNMVWAADDPNDDTVLIDGVNYHVLRSTDDWERFRELVNKAAGEEDVNAIMDADFTVTDWVGSSGEWPYRGIFNGNGHTLNVAINDPNNNYYISPFLYVSNATIRDLHVTGSVSGGKHSSGLVGTVAKPGNGLTLTVERVWVSTTVTANDSPQATGEFVGGFVGHAAKNTVKLVDCRFDGKLISTCPSDDDDKERVGGTFVGWGEKGSTYSVRRIYEYSSQERIQHHSICYYYDDKRKIRDFNDAIVYTSHNWSECNESRRNVKDQQVVVNGMNADKPETWIIVDGKAVPNIKSYTTDPTFECYDIVPGTEAGEEGMLKLPFSCDQVIKWIDVSYTDENGNKKELPRVTLPKNSYSGFIMLSATEAHRDLQMKVRLMVDSLSYTYDAKSDAVMHNPRNLTCDVLNYSKGKLTDAGAVVLHWDTKDAEYSDVVEGDQFVVYRSLTGKPEDMTSIGNVLVEGDVSKYEYKDSTLISALAAENITSRQAQVAYWVVRAAAQQLWGMDASKNPTVVTIQPQLDKLTLLEPIDVKADWSDKSEYKVKVAWNCKPNDAGNRYVWDNRVSMAVEVSTFNRAGEPVESTKTMLTAEQVQAGEIEVQATRPCVKYQIALLVDGSKSPLGQQEGVSYAATLPEDQFYHESIGKIDTESLVARELQSSVLLTWSNVDDEPVDFYEVWRRKVGDNSFELITDSLSEMQFEDKTVSPVHKYEYYVSGVNDCEGRKHVNTKTVEASCMQTCTVEGHLRLDDGTGVPDTKINIKSPDGQSLAVFTDETGFYRMDNLPYVNGTETTYQLAPALPDFDNPQSVTFKTTPGGNCARNIDFETDSSVKITGTVYYDGTSIPVQGVSFIVDDKYEIHNASGKVASDHEGKFAFRVLKDSKQHTLKAVKDRHVFNNDGYYKIDDDAPDNYISFTSDMAKCLFYDKTVVKLIGRVAGGKTQGDIPLGNSLSRNNLGDDIQIVFTLEGDNVSRLVSDLKNPDKKERDEEFPNKANDKKYDYKTKVHTTLNRKVVTPDIHTGEYTVELPPVKWKIQQITAKGYATLFQSGQVGDVIDLTDSLTLHKDIVKGSWTNADDYTINEVTVEYNAMYSRIYHSPVVIDYKQIGYEKFDFLGDQYYSYKDVKGNKLRLPLAYGVKKPNWPKGKKDSLETHYTFGYPVFSIDRKYPVKISATERYYYNNNIKSDTVEIVRLSGGEVTIHNGLLSSTHRDVIELDSVGEATYNLEAAQVPYLLTDKDALRTVTMTLEMDGTHYEAAPLRAYLLNIQQLKGAKDVLSYSVPLLVDVLRDPPGGNSKATLSKGSTLKYSYQMDLKWSGGLTLNIAAGNSLSTFTGVVAAPMGAGAVGGFHNSSSNAFATSIDLVFSGSGHRAFNYTMTATEDISTSSDKTLVGADGDLYIGVDQNIVIKPATAIRAIPDSVFQQMGGQLKGGRMLEIAQGTDGEGNLLHLVRDEVVTYGPTINSNFVHSQDYIIRQLIPSLLSQYQSLLFTGTPEQAKERANATGQRVYRSKVEPNEETFGMDYEIVDPDGYTGETIDEVAHYQEIIAKWNEMIGQNEREKLSARDLVRNFDIDGGTSINYGETFTSDYSNTRSYVSPISTSTVDYFDKQGGDITLNAVQILGPTAAKLLGSILKKKTGATEGATGTGRNEVQVQALGWTFSFNLVPALTFDVVPSNTEAKAFNRHESFSISMDKRSHLNFDVYRVETSTDEVKGDGIFDVFVGSNFYEQTSDNYDYLTREIKMDNYRQPRSFVYRTRAGATCRPYEGERLTQVYNPKTILDERTKKIENPVIKMDKQSISGVPFGEPARFKIYMTNESEQPEAAYNYFYIYQSEKSNPDGAKMLVDGMPLTGDGRTVEVRPGQVTEKTLEVYASEKFDYNKLKIGILSQGDAMVSQEVEFDVHYLQTAGAVSITTPGDKWILNCDAPIDDNEWYMPVIIGGFDKNQHNFDHIEFQYKESTRGDDYWTNLCGYYADSLLYKAASGTKEMIPENGNITTRFIGDRGVIEKAYDLRAVLFCRNGNAFLTHESKVLSGVKDTRRPQMFGNAEPMDGVLEAGESIIFGFSENVEYNYLREDVNFAVVGETNEESIQETPALLFDGKGCAQSEANRNFAGKDVTVEVMVMPDDTQKDMPIFSHGRDGKKLQLWVTADKHLRAVVDEQTLELPGELNTKNLQRVALVLDNSKQSLTLISESNTTSLDNVTYSGYGPLIFGSTNQPDVSERSFFSGRMLQARVWNRAMDEITLNMYGNKQLTGYERGLTDYYPMSEGRGDYATDLAQGAHLKLEGASWVLPRGMSLKLDMNEQKDIKGVQLKDTLLQRTAEQDYTLMFWFKTDDKGHGTLLCNGSGKKTDVNAFNKYFIGFEGSTLKYRSYGQEYVLGESYDDNNWHHYAMAVNRSRNVANIYVDLDLKAQFSTDSLGGIAGNSYLGNMVWLDEGQNNDQIQQGNPLSGQIDCIALYESALPESLIKRYADKAVSGKEKELMMYIDFERQEEQSSGQLVLKPFARNKVVHVEKETGKPTGLYDYLFVEDESYIIDHINQLDGAPVQAYEELRPLNFSFVGRDNRILININELDKRINKRTIYATVRDIPDKNGNFLASPVTMSMFVDLNPLRWANKTVSKTIQAGSYDTKFSMNIMNNSGQSHTYTVENLPRWLTVDKTADVLDAQNEQTLNFSINRNANVGTYDEVIYLVDENGMSEPLALNITIEGKKPDWYVSNDLKRYSMSVVGRVDIAGDIVTDERDIVAAFDAKGRCMGVANISDDAASESLVYMSVYDSTAVAKTLYFRLWHYESGKEMLLSPSQEVTFKPETLVGDTKNPLLLHATDLYVQHTTLKPGWNWVSVNVLNDSYRDVKKLLDSFIWHEGDMLTDENNQHAMLYRGGAWMSNAGIPLDQMMVKVSESYRIRVASVMNIELTGSILRTVGDRTITVKQGWNSIGYTPAINLPVATALADYFDEAEDGDIVKSQTAFAIFSSDGAGSGDWKGDLKYMKPGEGYMLYRKNSGEAKFVYPFYDANETFFEESGSTATAYSSNMTLTAIAEGIELQEGDKVIAYADAEIVGESIIKEDRMYMTITGDKSVPLSFVVERDGDVIAASNNALSYAVDAISGTYNEPTAINFATADKSQFAQHDAWYTLEGLKLEKKPVKRGIYIYNGRKQVIK